MKRRLMRQALGIIGIAGMLIVGTPQAHAQEIPPVLATGAVADLCVPKGCAIKQFDNIGLRVVHYRHDPTIGKWHTTKCDNFTNIPPYIHVWYSLDGITYRMLIG